MCYTGHQVALKRMSNETSGAGRICRHTHKLVEEK